MKTVGIDWSYSNAAYCCISDGGEITDEAKVPANRAGLSQLVSKFGSDVSASVEMMSGAYWVHDQLSACGWDVKIADAAKVKAVAPLACKTDKIDARVIAQLELKGLTPALWIRPADDRKLKEMVLFHSHLVGLRTTLKNRVYGVMTQWGLKHTLDRLKGIDYQSLLVDEDLPRVWRDSVEGAIGMVGQIDQRLKEHDQALLKLARKDPRVKRLMTIPGIGAFLGLAIAVEISDVSRFSSHKKLISYSGLAPRIKQSGKSEVTGPLSKAGSKLLRWAAVEAAQGAWRTDSPWHELYVRVKAKYGSANPAKAAVARKILTASWHVLSKDEDFKVCRTTHGDTVSASSTPALVN